MATVYRARDKRLGREVAVKVIHRHLRENKEVGQRFASEARAVAKVKHPGVVEVYDVSEDDSDERYLVVELVRGKTLRQLLTEEQYLCFYDCKTWPSTYRALFKLPKGCAIPPG